MINFKIKLLGQYIQKYVHHQDKKNDHQNNNAIAIGTL